MIRLGHASSHAGGGCTEGLFVWSATGDTQAHWDSLLKRVGEVGERSRIADEAEKHRGKESPARRHSYLKPIDLQTMLYKIPVCDALDTGLDTCLIPALIPPLSLTGFDLCCPLTNPSSVIFRNHTVG